MAAKASEYQKRQENGVTVFTVTPAASPKFTYLLIIGGVITFIGLMTMLGSPGFGIWFLAMGGFALWYGWKRDVRPKAHRVETSFRVSPEYVETNGRRIMKGDIHRLLLRNGITDKELDIQVYTTNTNQMAGMAQRANVARFANSLTVESGGKSIFLAGGMDETTAYGLLHDVTKVLGMTIS